MSWQFFLVISILSYSFSTLLQRALIKHEDSDPVAYACIFQILTGIMIGAYALINGFTMPNLLAFIPNVVLMIVLYGGMSIFTFKSLKLIDASEFSVIYASRVIWAVLAAIIFLGERFELRQFAGTIILLISVVIVSYKTKLFKISRGGLYAMFAGLLLSLGFTNDAFLVRVFDVPSYLFISFMLTGVGVLMVYPKSVKNMRYLVKPKTFIKLSVCALFYASAAVTNFLAYQTGRNAAQIGALDQSATIVTVFLAVVLLRETSDLWKKILAAILCSIGAFLIA